VASCWIWSATFILQDIATQPNFYQLVSTEFSILMLNLLDRLNGPEISKSSTNRSGVWLLRAAYSRTLCWLRFYEG